MNFPPQPQPRPGSAASRFDAARRASGVPLLPAEEVQQGIARALRKVDRLLAKAGGGFPDATCVRGKYSFHDNAGIVDANAWTSGFWPGVLWLAHELSGAERYRDAAAAYVPLLRARLDEGRWVDHHDLGFLYTLSCVAGYKLTGSGLACETALLAATRLLGRYRAAGGFIQAWGDLQDLASYRLIIDGLMNLPLLYWAGTESGEQRFRQAATRHLERTLATIVRPDASTYHTFFFDPATGAPSHGVTRQGFSDSSCWARGQAWAVYGIPLARRHVDDDTMMAVHARVTDYFLARLPEDGVCHWDLIFTSGTEERDSSAAAIAVCGLLEAVPWTVDGGRRARYEEAIRRIMRGLLAGYAAADDEDGLLAHAVYSKPHQAGVDECCIWGDYFYLEALRRLAGPWDPYW